MIRRGFDKLTAGGLDWLDARSGYRAGLSRLANEPLPAGTGWWFTLGSILLFLLAVQLLTGAFLTLYYAPTPDHAWESVRFITRDATLGWAVRGLHYFGASFLVVFALLHLLRVVLFGSFKRPRELTWITGVVLLLVILAFALSGYLLPWDQRAYWATVVTIRIAELAPLIGPALAYALRAGDSIGALTLGRWYAAHVIFLPALLVSLVGLHLYLMRRHGISGPVVPRPAVARPFHPFHAIRDVSAIVAVAITLVAFLVRGMPALEHVADPSDATYVPRPEWYFLGLFELLKYFPGKLEVVGAIVLPGVAVLLLLLLPWIDSSPERRPARRRAVLSLFAMACLVLAGLTMAGVRDSARSPDRGHWLPREIAGQIWAGEAQCVRCHAAAAVADPLSEQPMRHLPDWLMAHVVDPEVIAPGVRPPPEPEPQELRAAAMAAYARRLYYGAPAATPSAADRAGALVFAGTCIACHTIDGDGGDDGPNLSHIGREHDRDWLRRWIADPTAVNPDAEMPAFGDELSPEQIDAVAAFLAERK